MAKKAKPRAQRRAQIDAYAHAGEKRANNPPVGLVSSATDELNGRTVYAHDPHINPHLSWAGKAEKNPFAVKNVSLHIHERIDAHRIIQSFVKQERAQPSLFDNPARLSKAVQFYQHEEDWTNRLVAGDSLLVMNSLLRKEAMAGKVQMIFIDPPYGIKYNSNFQPFVNNQTVKDDDKGIPAEPEMIRAFRDTWELGIHSYLTYLHDRLLLAKELLRDSGSVFVQINDENVNLVHQVVQEIFEAKNFMGLIPFQTKTPLGTKGLPGVVDYLVWFAKDKKQAKYHQLFLPKDVGDDNFDSVHFSNGEMRKLTAEEKRKPKSILQADPRAKFFKLDHLNSSGYTPSCVFEFSLGVDDGGDGGGGVDLHPAPGAVGAPTSRELMR